MSKSKFYTEKEMVEELRKELEALGCYIEYIDTDNRVFKLDVPDEIEEEARELINHVMNEYITKRHEVMLNNPFYGVYDIIEDLGLEDKDE